MKFPFGAGLWPVVQRELRAAARWIWGPWLRMGGALGGIVALCAAVLHVSESQLGLELFGNVQVMLLYLICALVPPFVADCIARERREGTLGLLFLTPLTASGIVLGKSLAQALRVLTVALAVVPVLTIPFLLGGVTWRDVLRLLGYEMSVGMLCLAAGLLASSLTERRGAAFVLAFVFMAAFLLGAIAFLELSGTDLGSLESFANAAALLLGALRVAGFCVQRSWQDKLPSVRRQNWVRRYGTPIFKRWFARSMRRALEKNPIAWLQQYSWKARACKWGLCLLIILMECAVLTGNDFYSGQSRVLTILLLLLAAAYTYAGVNGFFQEKKSGALELILVTPLTVNQIIFGRVRGLWKQFFPSILVLVASDIALQILVPGYGLFYPAQNYYASSHVPEYWMMAVEIVAVYLTLPVVATSFALGARNLIVVSALAVAMVFGPTAVWLFHEDLLEILESSIQLLPQWLSIDIMALLTVLPIPPLPFCIILAHACSAFLAYRYLSRSLARRSYAFA